MTANKIKEVEENVKNLREDVEQLLKEQKIHDEGINKIKQAQDELAKSKLDEEILKEKQHHAATFIRKYLLAFSMT